MKILVVKLSSLGDILQTFPALERLASYYPRAEIDWVVEEQFAPLIQHHPLLGKVHLFPWKKGSVKQIFSSLRRLWREKYDLIFDFQGNTKSGLLTFCARGRIKVGMGKESVREWPNLLATHRKFEVGRGEAMPLLYQRLVDLFCREEGLTPSHEVSHGPLFSLSAEERVLGETILSAPELRGKPLIMVCPGSRWPNKRLPVEAFRDFLRRIEENLGASFLLIWGNEAEREYCEELGAPFPERSFIPERLSFSLWHWLMERVDLLIGVDSSALHLSATTSTPSFSLFGPTAAAAFRPPGDLHASIQGKCPYQIPFEKQCPYLRTCPTGACLRSLKGSEIYEAFAPWWSQRGSLS